MKIRSTSDSTWTMTEYGARMFEMGGSIYGPRSQMFKLAVAAACVDVLSQDVSKTPIRLRRRTSNGAETVRPDQHPVAALLTYGPNDFMANKEFLSIATAHLALHSEYLIACRRRNDLEVMEFCGIPRQRASIQVNPAPDVRKMYYDVTPGSLHEQMLYGWADGRLDHDSVAHIRRRTMNGLDVMSTMALASDAISLLTEMNGYQSAIFANGGVPKVAFTFPDELTDDQFERLKRGLEEASRTAQKTGKPIILEGNGKEVPKVEKLSLSSTDADFVKSHINAAMDIIRYFRVPPHKVYLMESIKYDNMDSAERVYVDDTLRSYFEDIATAMTRVLLTRAERADYFIEFDIERAYAMDPLQRNKIIESRWNSGLIELNEAREKIGENTYVGDAGRVRKIAGAFALVDRNNEVVLASKSDAGTKEPDPDKEIETDDKGLRVVQGGKE